ncbi:hypothetical protein Tco_1579674, partial [Tanacetum coccineum]
TISRLRLIEILLIRTYKNDLSKTVTPHYLPKVRESAAAKPHQVNAPNISGPVPPRKNVVSLADKTDSSQKEMEFLFNHLFEEYFSWNFYSIVSLKNISLQQMFMLKKTTMIKQRMHRFDKMNLSILSIHRYKTLLSLTHAILIMKICIHFNKQMSTEEPKNSKEAMADSAWIEAMQDELH